eukprot:782048-Rhodomonas_salina.3
MTRWSAPARQSQPLIHTKPTIWDDPNCPVVQVLEDSLTCECRDRSQPIARIAWCNSAHSLNLSPIRDLNQVGDAGEGSLKGSPVLGIT